MIYCFASNQARFAISAVLGGLIKYITSGQRSESCVQHSRFGLGITFAILTATLLGCASRPYSCKYFTYPPDKDVLGGGWTHLATVCETRVSPDIFKRWSGEIVTVVVRNEKNEILEDREVRFTGELQIGFSAIWIDDRSLSVDVYSERAQPKMEKEKTRIATIYLLLSKQQ